MSKVNFAQPDALHIFSLSVCLEKEFFFVKDQGLNLMVSGTKELDTNAHKHRISVVYVRHCSPHTDPNIYDTSQELVGGDDFGEVLKWTDAEQLMEGFDRKNDNMAPFILYESESSFAFII